jgi:phosphatidate cytidylyltransferase
MLWGSALASVGIAALWAGGGWFLALVVAVVGIMVWELARLLDPAARRRALLLAMLAGTGVAATALLPPAAALPLVLVPALAGLVLLPEHRTIFAIYASLMVVAGFGLWHLRSDFGQAGLRWMLWLALIVIATDVLGYFAGRLIGGPKIWPAISPNKTWAGTIAGWIGAAFIGLGFAGPGGAAEMVGLSVALAMAAQLGDAAESALKRKMGVKDASNLIPGHGGMMDRFDGMLGAAVLFLLVEQAIGFPVAG